MIKKKQLLLIIIGLFVVISIYISQPPNLKVYYENTKLEVLKCPFSWDAFLNNNTRDYLTTPELATKLSATTVKPQSTLDFSFNKKPNSFQVSLWNKESEEYQSNNDQIVVPTEKGTYVFSVIGTWNKGQVLYVFKIKVE